MIKWNLWCLYSGVGFGYSTYAFAHALLFCKLNYTSQLVQKTILKFKNESHSNLRFYLITDTISWAGTAIVVHKKKCKWQLT